MSSDDPVSTTAPASTDAPAPSAARAPWSARLILQTILISVVGPVSLIIGISADPLPGRLLGYAGAIFWLVTIIESVIRAFQASRSRALIWLAAFVVVAIWLTYHVAVAHPEPEHLIAPAVLLPIMLVTGLVAAFRSPRGRMQLPMVINLTVVVAYSISVIWFAAGLIDGKN